MRKATIKDAKGIQYLIKGFAIKNQMLPRSLNEIYENIRDFWLIEEKGKIIACCALHPLWEDMAEIKSLVVVEESQGKKIGKKLVQICIDECADLKIKKVFALTYVPEFFEKLGFKKGKKETMPHKIWSECIRCHHFPDCDEVLVEKIL